MSEHNHTGLDEAASVASNTMQAVRTGKAISAAAKGAAAGGPYGAAIGAALSARKHIGKIAAARWCYWRCRCFLFCSCRGLSLEA